MRITFTMLFVAAATLLTGAAIIPRGNVSRSNHSSNDRRRGVEGRHGRTHPREFFFTPDNADIPQRRTGAGSDGTEAYRRHPRDFLQREPRAVGPEGVPPVHTHPREFAFARGGPSSKGSEGDLNAQIHARRTLVERFHPRQFRSPYLDYLGPVMDDGTTT